MPEIETPEGSTCAKKVYRRSGSWDKYHLCGKRAVVVVDGKPYCGTHRPEAVARREAASREKYDAKAAIRWREQLATQIIGGATDDQLRRAIGLGGVVGMLAALDSREVDRARDAR